MTQNNASMTKDNIGLIYINGLGFYINAFGIDGKSFGKKTIYSSGHLN